MKLSSGIASLAVVGLFVAWAAAAEEAAATAPALCRCQGDPGTSVERINLVLSQPLKSAGLDFTEEPLNTVMNFLETEYEIPIQLDESALEDAGLTPDEKVTVNLQNVSLRSALRLLLKTLQLTYVIRDEVLMITTPEEAESELVVCVYDVRDLIGGKYDAKRLNSLVDVIVSCVATETWAKNGGGEAVINPLQPGLLVVSQTQAVHEQIGGLLRVIRETLRQPTEAISSPESAAAEARGGHGRGGYGGGYGEAYGGRGDRMQPEPTPADDSPFQ